MSTDASILRRWRRRAAAATALLALTLSLIPVPALGAPFGSYEDYFTAGNYSGDDGWLSWTTDWTEMGESDGPGGGSAEVTNEPHCSAGNCLILGRGGVDNADAGVWRQADLSGADTVTLQFWYERHRHFSGQGFVRLSVSPDGSTWHDLADYQLDINDGGDKLALFDITTWATSTSQIRFELFNSTGDDSHMNIDWVEIRLDVSNQAPILDPIGDQATNEGALLSFAATATDPDAPPDTLRFSLTGAPAGAAIDPVTGDFTWTPTETQHGPHTFDVVVTDDGTPTKSDSETITITVTETNTAPTMAHPGNQTSYEGATVDITIVASDPDIPSQPIALTASGLPPGLRFDPSTGSITGTIADGSAADSPFTVSVIARDGSSEAGLTFRWSVTVPNLPPTGADAAFTTLEDGPLNARLTAVDPDGDPVSIIVRGRPSLGTLTVDGTRIRHVPSPGVTGTDTFTYAVSDGKAASGTYTVTIVIEALNAAPVADDDHFETAAGETLRIAAPGLLLNDTDPDGDPLVVRLVAAPNHGGLTLAGDGSLTYRPVDGFVGTDHFTYEIADPSGERSVATSLITVAPAPAVPATSSATRAMVVDEIMAAEPELAEAAEPEPLVGRSLVLMNRAARAGVEQMGFPLVLLLAALVGVLSVGRVSAVPWLRRGERQTGIVHTYDDEVGYGLVVRDEDSAEVFVHRVAIPRRLRAALSVGDAVDFYAITGPHRDVVRKLRLRR